MPAHPEFGAKLAESPDGADCATPQTAIAGLSVASGIYALSRSDRWWGDAGEEEDVEGELFDRLTRWLRGGTSRRAFGLVLAGSLGIVAADDGEAKRKKKKKKKCGNSCGSACCTVDQVCAFTGGSTPRCINKIHTCTAEDNICLPAHSGQVWCNYDNDCKCHQTVAGQVACVADTVGTACGNCTQDSDCTTSFGAGARCVQAGPGCTTSGCTRGFCKRACPA